MRKRVKTLIASSAAAAMIGALGVIGVAGSAGASVARYQIETLQYTVTVAGSFTHSYTVTANPCDGTFTATGQYPASPAEALIYETLTGYTDGVGGLYFTGTYFSDSALTNPTGYWWTFAGSFTDSNLDFSGYLTNDKYHSSELPVTGTLDSFSATNYSTHGQYVASSGGGSDAAHSCIGMPMVGPMSNN
ncbi:MAG: hypothetical protein KGJ92_06330 [Actinomycetales bacterium]|nr:hypothetical protein [Actinomycetales bacterium]